jgi:hypothetical protein
MIGMMLVSNGSSPRSTTTSDRTDACRHRSNSAERSVTARGTPAFVSVSTSSASFAPQPVVKSIALSRWIWIGRSLKAMSSIRTRMMKSGSLRDFLTASATEISFWTPLRFGSQLAFETTKTTLSVRFRNASSMLFKNGVPPARSKMSAQTLYPKPVSLVPSQRTNSLSFGVAWLIKMTSRSDISKVSSYLAAACRFPPLEEFLGHLFEKHGRRDVLFRGRDLDTLDNLRMTAIWLVSPAIQGAQDQSFQLTSESSLSAAAVDSQQSVARDALAALSKSTELAKPNDV